MAKNQGVTDCATQNLIEPDAKSAAEAGDRVATTKTRADQVACPRCGEHKCPTIVGSHIAKSGVRIRYRKCDDCATKFRTEVDAEKIERVVTY